MSKYYSGPLSRLTTLLRAVGSNKGFDVEVIDPKAKVRKVKAEDGDKEVSLWGLNGRGRQENSLGTVRSISQVLYTNIGWSVHTCLGQAYILKQVAHTLGQVQIQRTGGL